MAHKNYKPRVFLLFLSFVCGYVFIIGRIFIIQIYHQNFYEELAKSQYQTSVTIQPARAEIFDRNGSHIALNKQALSAFLVPRTLKNPSGVLAYLKKASPQLYRRLVRNRKKRFMWIERDVCEERLNVLKKALGDDLCFVYEPKRYYPLQAMASIAGFTDIDNKGLSGIELEFSNKLQGQSRTLIVERDARSRNFYFEKRIEEKGYQGKPITLTIDTNLQQLAFQELKQTVDQLDAVQGSVLVLNPDNGDILAMVNYPSFNPNEKVSAQDMWLTKNNIVTECYEMGSVMKIFTALAALQEREVTSDEIIDCGYRFSYIDGFRIENPTITLNRLLEKNKGKISFNEVLRYSSNVGIAKIAKRLDSRLYTHLSNCGFGSKTGLSFPGERSGFVNPPNKWSRSSVLVMAFGYEIMATLMQLGLATSIMANGGYKIKPRIILGKNIEKKEKLYGAHALVPIKKMLSSIGKKFPVPGFSVWGKTGTARCIENGAYSNKKHIYTFAGIVEKGNYRRVIVTFVRETKKSGLWASQVSAPLFQKVAHRMVAYEKAKCTTASF